MIDFSQSMVLEYEQHASMPRLLERYIDCPVRMLTLKDSFYYFVKLRNNQRHILSIDLLLHQGQVDQECAPFSYTLMHLRQDVFDRIHIMTPEYAAKAKPSLLRFVADHISKAINRTVINEQVIPFDKPVPLYHHRRTVLPISYYIVGIRCHACDCPRCIALGN